VVSGHLNEPRKIGIILLLLIIIEVPFYMELLPVHKMGVIPKQIFQKLATTFCYEFTSVMWMQPVVVSFLLGVMM